MTNDEKEIGRLRAIIRQAIWDLGCQRPEMALLCLRYAGVEESPLPAQFAAQGVSQQEKT